MNTFSLRSGTSQGFLLSLFLFNNVLKILGSSITQEKEIEGSEIIKEEINLDLFLDDIAAYKNS